MEFKRQKMVKWYSVSQLAASGVKSLVSTIFGNFADKREAEALADNADFYDYADKESLWIDFISDLGDGFDSTYTMAHLLAKKSLSVNYKSKFDGNTQEELQRGNLLIMGGDEVYPTPSKEAYNNKLKGPYSAAFPQNPEDPDRPHLFAIPGNHDWYDGLSSFLKVFCQKRSVGNWLTRQSRSYFAIKLPHGVWIWGIDVQLKADIDLPQLHYFDKMAREHMAEGDKVMLCTAEPAWVYQAISTNKVSFERFNFFVNRYFKTKSVSDPVIASKKLGLVTVLTGDLHHYSRYEENLSDGTTINYFTAGGGGAFMHLTHMLPDKLTVNENLTLKAVYPKRNKARTMATRNLYFPITNAGVSSFIAILILMITWLLQSAVTISFPGQKSFLENVASATLSEYHHLLFTNLQHNPAAVLLILIFFGGFILFTNTTSGKYNWNYIPGVLHALLQLINLCLIIWIFPCINLNTFHLPFSTFLNTVLLVVEIYISGFLIGGLIFGVYLTLSTLLFKANIDESSSGLRYSGFKNFLRIHITKTDVKVYPIGVRRAVTNWNNIGTVENPKFVGDEIGYELIEDPVPIKIN